MKSFFREAQQRGTVRVRIFLFIIRKAHGQVCTDYFLSTTPLMNDEELKKNMYPVNISMFFHEANKSLFVFYK